MLQSEDLKQKVEYVRPTKFIQVSHHFSRSFNKKNGYQHCVTRHVISFLFKSRRITSARPSEPESEPGQGGGGGGGTSLGKMHGVVLNHPFY